MKLTQGYICGLVDGEGSFSLHLGVHNKYIPQPQFSIRLTRRDAYILHAIRDYLDAGKVYERKPETNAQGYTSKATSQYVVNSGRDCLRVVDFFDENPLILKAPDFAIWSEAIRLWTSREWRGRMDKEKLEQSERLRELEQELKALHN